MKAMKWITTDEPLNRRSDEVYHMHNGSMPEETRFMQKSLEQITVALLLVNGDLKDETTKFDEHILRDTPDIVLRHFPLAYSLKDSHALPALAEVCLPFYRLRLMFFSSGHALRDSAGYQRVDAVF